MTLTVASECLGGCTGCEMAILDLGERLFALLEEVELRHMPFLLDVERGNGADEWGGRPAIPEADVGLLSGGLRSTDHLDLAGEMRRKCRTIVALGTCATHGGIPALANQASREELLHRVFQPEEAGKKAILPAEGLPPLLDRTYALDEKIRVDVWMPGCPPHPDLIFEVLGSLARGESPGPSGARSVCDTCPTRKEGKNRLRKIERPLRNPHFDASAPLDQMRCLLEQELLCMGPVTRAGCCGATPGAPPRCIAARAPCRGCFGPVKPNGNQLMDMLNALVSNGIDVRRMPERFSLLRFSGAHGRLKERKPGSTGGQRSRDE